MSALTATTEVAVGRRPGRRGAHWLGPLDRAARRRPRRRLAGLRPTDPLLRRGDRARLPVWGEVELAWRLRGRRRRAVARGHRHERQDHDRAHARGDAARGRAARAGGRQRRRVADRRGRCAATPYDVLAVELSSQQLHFAPSMRPAAGALLNLATITSTGTARWRPTPRPRPRSGAARSRSATPTTRASRGCSATAPGEHVGVHARRAGARPARRRDGHLVSRAFGDDHVVLAAVDDVRPAGVAQRRQRAGRGRAGAGASASPPTAIAAGLAAFVPDPHRNQPCRRARRRRLRRRQQGDQPARGARLAARLRRVVWIAGGQLKGASVDELVARSRRGWPARCCSASTAPIDRRGAAATRAGCPGDRGRRHTTMERCWRSCAPRPGWRARATPCCSPPPPRPTTCSPTTRARRRAFADAASRTTSSDDGRPAALLQRVRGEARCRRPRGRRRALPRPAVRLGAAAAARRRPGCSASAC